MLKLISKKKRLIVAIAATMLIIFNLGKIQYYGIVISAKYYKPDVEFSPLQMAKEPDFNKDEAWLSLPMFSDEADISPVGVTSINDGNAKFDAFYIHGTGFISGSAWTSSLKGDVNTQNNAKFSLANEASIFNSCCNIFAPRYRQANLFTFFGLSESDGNRVLDHVYKDVQAAFFNFIMNRNGGRPFFIVSHSQGTQLIKRLLTELNDFPQITNRIIAVYAIGDAITPVSSRYVDSLSYLDVCTTPEDTQCLIHWETIGDGGGQLIFPFSRESVCVNPLSWAYNERYAHDDLHLGAASISGKFKMNDGSNTHDVGFSVPAITTNYTKAQCKKGLLYVNDPTGSNYAELGLFSDHAMHGANFAIFHMNIRKNAILRAESF
jgi:hypothetical protein